MKKLITYIILMVVLACSVFALSASGGSIYIREKGNTGISGSTDHLKDYTAYSVNYPSDLLNYSSSSYAECNIGASAVNPISVDFNKDGYGEILTVIGSIAYLYNRDCELVTSFTVAIGGSIYNPAMDNQDGDDQMNIYFGNSSFLSNYQYNDDYDEFEYKGISSRISTGVDNYVCPYLSGVCLGPTETVGSNFLMTKLSLIFDDSITISGFHQISSINGGSLDSDRHNALHSYRAVYAGGGYYYRVPVLFIDDSSNDLYLSVWDGSAGTDITTGGILSMAGTSATLSYYDAFIAKLGSTVYLFDSYVVNPGTYDYFGTEIRDLSSLTALYSRANFSASAGSVFRSNWIVGDIDKDGNNEACYLRGENFTQGTSVRPATTHFICLSSPTAVETDADVTGIININKIAMADFDGNNSYAEIVSCEGIFRYNGATLTKIFNSTVTGNCTGDMEVFEDGSSGLMAALYTSSTAGFLIRSTDVGANCGDDTCGLYENSYNCLEDCPIDNVSTPGTTYTNGTAPVGTWVGLGNGYICESGYAEYNKCALKPGGYDCTYSSECLSSTCANGKCNSADIWDSIEQSSGSLFGVSSTAKLILALLITVGLTVLIIFASHGSAAGVIVGLGVTILGVIFFTIVGWLPVFFILGIVLLIVIVIGFMLLMKGGG